MWFQRSTFVLWMLLDANVKFEICLLQDFHSFVFITFARKDHIWNCLQSINPFRVDFLSMSMSLKNLLVILDRLYLAVFRQNCHAFAQPHRAPFGVSFVFRHVDDATLTPVILELCRVC